MFKGLLVAASVAAPALAQSGAYQQCGGIGWTGDTSCVSGWVCQYSNNWYSQCLPDSDSTTTSAAPITSASPTTTSVPTTSETPTSTEALESLCTQYEYLYLANEGYEMINNLWGMDDATSGSQCTYYNGPSGEGISFSSDWNWEGNPNNVKSYIYANPLFERKLVSDISSMPTTVTWSYNDTDIRANVAYDIFTATDPDHVNWHGEYEIMIWLELYGGIWPITDSATGSPDTYVTLAGHNWEFYTGWNGDMRVYSFLPADGAIESFDTDAKVFFDYLVAELSFPETEQYMLIYNFGTEAFTGGPVSFVVDEFAAGIES